MWVSPVFRRFVLASWLFVTASACDGDVPVPELDQYWLFEPKEGESMESVLRRLGEPARRLVLHGQSEGIEIWTYPIRCCDPAFRVRGVDIGAPAVQLKIFLDDNSVVTDWGFFHPETGQRMAIREGPQLAKLSFYLSIHRTCWRGEQIELSKVLKIGKIVKTYELRRLEFETFEIPPAQENVLVYYVDRPSPFYIPARAFMVKFKDGKVWDKHPRYRARCAR